jgi:uncharacterized protein DUF4326
MAHPTGQPTATTTRCRCICPNGCDCGCTCPAATELRAEQNARRAADGGPIRIQRISGRRKPAHAAYVGRPTRFGNPYRLVRQDTGWAVQFGDHGGSVGTFHNAAEARRYAAEAFRVWINLPEQADTRRLFRALLHGRDLTCWCPLDEPCHADVLIELARQPAAS